VTNPAPGPDARRPLAYRLSGADRYATAQAVARKYVARPPVVYVATGRAFPDALAGSALAGVEEVPVLLTGRDSVPAATRDALEQLQPARIVVLGGEGVVADPVLDVLAQYTDGPVSRLAGANRYGTAEL